MNESWKSADAEAHAAKAEALQTAIETVEGIMGALDGIETMQVENTLALLRRAHDRHEQAARLVGVA